MGLRKQKFTNVGVLEIEPTGLKRQRTREGRIKMTPKFLSVNPVVRVTY